jgi:hypothetical protein
MIELDMPQHCTVTEFLHHTEDPDAIFALTSIGSDDIGDLFYGTVDQFADCFFSNVDYINVLNFANKENCRLTIVE